ncbi:unnamed protein product [Pleuronectes platessa]|uniref:Uncharacterized protein n=1 Tax=Pleuronectes platessa TaxID=8262 RepID=A0A9N7URE7_PLEPL|nr:unnamed protein product [Pleuronectes platessa]
MQSRAFDNSCSAIVQLETHGPEARRGARSFSWLHSRRAVSNRFSLAGAEPFFNLLTAGEREEDAEGEMEDRAEEGDAGINPYLEIWVLTLKRRVGKKKKREEEEPAVVKSEGGPR